MSVAVQLGEYMYNASHEDALQTLPQEFSLLGVYPRVLERHPAACQLRTRNAKPSRFSTALKMESTIEKRECEMAARGDHFGRP